jgi:ParB family chromosome partitioning protein
MTKRKSDFTLPTTSLDELFSSQEERDDAKLERVKDILLTELHPFKDHPFKIQNDDEMKRLMESIQKFGTLTPALARPLPEGGYELISGHRRLAACQVLGIETMPVIVRDMSDDEAVIAMVDANLQREHILPSEKAFAYKMKLDAIKHQGITSSQLGTKLIRSDEKVAMDAGESRNQVQRYIRLTYLIPELLEMVDDGKIAFNPAVEISYLEQSEQRVLLNAMELNDCTPSHAQAIRLKKLSQEGVLQDQTIYDTLAEQKPNQQEQYKFKREDIRKYFPKSYTDKQVCDTVIKLLEQWRRRRERDRDSR